MLKKYNQFFEGKTTKVEYSKEFYLKKFAESKNGKAVLIGFEIKNNKYQLWVPVKAVYNIFDNNILDLPSIYNKIVLANFIYKPDTYDKVHKEREEFFNMYKLYMLPVIEKLKSKELKIKTDKIYKDFEDVLYRVIPGLDVISYDSKDRFFETDLGRIYIFKEDPLEFRVGNVYLRMEEDGAVLDYDNKFVIKLLGKHGILGKALVKINSGQRINAVEKMAIKRIYLEKLKLHDWHYQRSDDKIYYKKGQEEFNIIKGLQDILKSVGEEDFSTKNYNNYI